MAAAWSMAAALDLIKGALSQYTQANEYHFDGPNSIETTNH